MSVRHGDRQDTHRYTPRKALQRQQLVQAVQRTHRWLQVPQACTSRALGEPPDVSVSSFGRSVRSSPKKPWLNGATTRRSTHVLILKPQDHVDQSLVMAAHIGTYGWHCPFNVEGPSFHMPAHDDRCARPREAYISAATTCLSGLRWNKPAGLT